MIVQCPSCTSRYRIRDTNIPPSGGKIRCPSCSHSFIVYPEAKEEEAKTSITGSNEIAALLGGEGGDGGDKTEVVGGDALDKMRALEALKNEMGGALEGDGTVEMQNPLDMWKAAQAATKAAAEAEAEEDGLDSDYSDATVDHDDYDMAKTEIVSPDALNIPIPAFSNSGGNDEPKKPSIPRPNLPKPSIPSPSAGNDGVWQDPDRTVDAGMNVETAALKAPQNLPEMRDDSAPQQQPPQQQPPAQPIAHQPPQQPAPPAGPPGPPPRPPVPQPPAQTPAPQAQAPRVTQEDSGPNSPTTDPFSLPESDPFAMSDSGAANAAPEVPVGSQANDPFANAAPQTPEAPTQDAPAAPAAGGPDPRHQGPWKLKTNFGLTYEFPDNKSLRSWMSSREELDGHTLSADGENFYAINEFPQLHRSPSMVSQQIPSYAGDGRPPSGSYQPQPPAAASGPIPAQGPGDSGLNAPPPGMAAQAPVPQPPSSGSGGFTPPDQFGSGQHSAMPSSGPQPGFGGNPAPGFSQPMSQPTAPAPAPAPVRNEYVPPSQASAWDKVLWLVLLVLIIAAGVIAVQTFGVFDVVGEARKVLGMPPKVDTQQIAPLDTNDTNTNETSAAIEPDEEAQAELAEQLMRDARRFVKTNKFPAALKKLETVEQIDDTNLELYELRAEIYDELGQEEDAKAARDKISELSGAAGDQPDAGTPDAS